MSKRSWPRRLGTPAVAVMLACLSGCLMSGPACRQAEILPVSGKVMTAGYHEPMDEVCGFGMKPASILQKAGLKGSDLPVLNQFPAKVGVPLANVEAFVVVCYDLGERRALLVRANRGIDQKRLKKACKVDDEPRKGRGDPAVHTGSSGLAVHFPGPRLALITDSPETMRACLGRKKELLAHLDEAGKHDLTAWGKAIPYDPPPQSTTSPPLVPGTSYYPGGVLRRFVARAAPPPAAARDGLQYLPVPAPAGARSAWLALDLGVVASCKAEVEFADEASAKAGKEVVASYLEMARGLLIMGRAQVNLMSREDVLELGSEGAWVKQLAAAVPQGMVKRAEKGLESASVEAKGKHVKASFGVGVKAEDGPAVGKLLRLVRKEFKGSTTFGPGLVFSNLPRPQERIMPPSPGDLVPPADPLVVPPPGVVPLPPDMPPPPPPVINYPPPRVPPPPDVPTQPKAAKFALTVASVLKEDALLFTSPGAGEFNFVQKLPAGEAVDLPARKGEHWVAVFMSDPYRATFTVDANGQTWLLRPKPVVVQMTTSASEPVLVRKPK